MKAISAAIIVLAGTIFSSTLVNHDAAIIGAGMIIVGGIYWILEMGRREE